MGTDRPLISIVMAVYKPDRKWLREQLISLNDQTYPNLELLICDDCPNAPVEEDIFSELITKMPFKLWRNETNLGSNKTFERLTTLANGEYIAYCDQDDVWRPDKLEKMQRTMERTGALLVYSDMNIIDGDGNKTADSIKSVYKHITFCSGDGLFPTLLINYAVTGCAMMIKTSVAVNAVPFADTLVHDHWLAINAAAVGRLEFMTERLIDHRQHGNNQTTILKNVSDKKSYYKEVLTPLVKRTQELRRLYSESTKETLDEFDKFVSARVGYSRKANFSDLKTMIRYRKFARLHVMLEIAMKLMPERFFCWVISLIKSGKL